MAKKIIYEISNVSKQYKDGKQKILALQNTNLKIYEGELVAIIGPSGSGKSTLLTIMGGLLTPTSGTLKIDGEDFYSKNEKARAQIRFQKIGFVLQSSNLVPFLTVKQQLKLKNNYEHKKFDIKKANEIFQQLDISDIAKKYPSEISGGQKQRVAIASALFNDPKIILADEPTANLDSKKAFEVVQLLENIAHRENRSVIMVTHDTRLLKFCDRVFQIEDGKLKQ